MLTYNRKKELKQLDKLIRKEDEYATEYYNSEDWLDDLPIYEVQYGDDIKELIRLNPKKEKKIEEYCKENYTVITSSHHYPDNMVAYCGTFYEMDWQLDLENPIVITKEDNDYLHNTLYTHTFDNRDLDRPLTHFFTTVVVDYSAYRVVDVDAMVKTLKLKETV